MFELEFMERVERDYRNSVLYPKAERNERLLRELRRIEQAERAARPRRGPVRWIGDRLVGAGDMLISLGERLSPPKAGTTAPPT